MEERLRMCIACRQQKDKRSLKRIVKSPQGDISIDSTGKKSGRGAYLCSAQCLIKCKKAKLLNRAFKCEVAPEVYERLSDEFKEF